MAKKNNGKNGETKQELVDDSQEMVVSEHGGLMSTALPDWMEKSHEGKEDITAEDIRLPRLCIAQGLSHQMLPDNPKYIEGLRLFEMFNDVTGEIYGRGPLKIIPLHWQIKNIEFDPNDRNIILDPDVPSGDPRTKWTRDDQGNKFPPAATRFTEIVSLLIREQKPPELIVVSIKETNRHMRFAAQVVSGTLTEGDRAIYARVIGVKTVSATFDEGTAGVFVFIIRPVLYVQDRALYTRAQELHRSLQGKTIVIERESGVEDATEFDPDKLERESESA